jgi:anti-sigma-K factor RskA
VIGEDDELLAAELALGVLDGAERTAAQARAATQPDFAAAVRAWELRLAPMLDQVAPATPPPATLASLLRQAGRPAAANDALPALRRRLTLWRSATGGAAALAAGLALVLLVRPETTPPPARPQIAQQGAPPLIAVIGDKGAPKMLASFDPAARDLVVAGGAPLPVSTTQDYELWVIPAAGKPVSLGLMPANSRLHKRLPVQLAALVRSGATLAVSVEPEGGSPTGQPTGDVIASGALAQA